MLSTLEGLAPAGYAIALHVRFTTPTHLFQTYPKEWNDLYSQNGYVLRDPTVHWGFEQTGLIRWQALMAADMDGIISLAREYGMRYGFTYAIERGDSRSISSFTRSDRDFTDPEMQVIATLVDDLHDQTAKAPGTPSVTH